MNEASDDSRRVLRRGVYLVLIALATGQMVGRIMAVNSVDNARLEKYLVDRETAPLRDELAGQGLAGEELEQRLEELSDEVRARRQQQRPFLSSNDRSRWATARALVEHGTYAIDEIVEQPTWDTIDMVKHDGQGGEAPGASEGKLYSSKPPLLATLMAAEYWLIHALTGATLGDHPHEIGRFMLVTINVVPMVFYFILLAGLVERYGTTDWGRVFVMGAATLGTFLTTFAVVINNHLVAAVSVAAALAALLAIWYDERREGRYFVIAGFFAAFAAANELPAAALLALVGAALLWKAPRQTIVWFAPAVLVVGAAFFGTNYVAHGTFVPPYAHRSEGDNWYEYEFMRGGRARTSYWSENASRSKVDQGEPSRAVYALHVLVGHHGIFSLTPVWLVSMAGLGMMLARRPTDLRAAGAMIAILSLVCLTFYLTRPLIERSYGGSTSAFRWMFWFAPLWLLAMTPAADCVAGRRGWKIVLALLLGSSAMSAAYPTWNPWTHPWLWNAMQHVGLTQG